MFSGIIEEIGTISKTISIRGGKRIFITANKILTGLKIGDSVAVSGVCLTVMGLEKNRFVVEAVGETLTKTSVKLWPVQKKVNLERALQVQDRLGGHLVQGHINGLARVIRMVSRGDNWYLQLEIPRNLEHYLIPEGSIAVDGVSLTIADWSGRKVGISIIPHTYRNTVIRTYKSGELVNIEIDFMARYIEKFVKTDNKQQRETFSAQWFKNLGYQ